MHQHLVEYKDITIFFFALVDYHGKRSCNPINVAEQFFKKHKLPMVKMTSRKECVNIGEVIGILKELSKEVAQNPIEEDAEGSVIYFEGKWNDKVEILSLCKLKTLEYRLYRKLREKVKPLMLDEKPNSSKKKKIRTPADQLNNYQKEVEHLCREYKPPKPLEHYYEIAKLAFDFVSANKETARKLGINHRYLDFLKVIKACQTRGSPPTIDDFAQILATPNLLSESDLEDEEPEKVEERKETEKTK